ncbi:MAG: hypothetical protein RSD35_07710 [Oscillospiraceae bacterium]
MDEKDIRKQKKRDFLKGFFIALVFILPVYTGAVLFSSLNTLIFPQTEQASEITDKLPVASVAKSYNLMVSVYDSNQKDKLMSLAMLRFDTDSYRIIMCALPVSMVVLDDKAPQTLEVLFASRGILGIESAIRETLSVKISGYISLGTDELMRIIDEMGELEYFLADDIAVYDESGIITYSKHAGASRFTGNDVIKLMVFGTLTGSDKTGMHENLWKSALQTYADKAFPEKILALYSKHISEIESNISAAGIYSLIRSAKAVCSDTGAEIEIFRLDGEENDGRFELGEESNRRLWVYFPQSA